MLEIDERSFKDTAEVVHAINEAMSDRYKTPDDLKHFMFAMAFTYSEKSAWFSTGGFCLTAFDVGHNKRKVVASVMAYTAHRHVFK